MKEDYLRELIRYRIERAHETFEEALLMQDKKHWNTCANRLYYACFYAVTALLVKHDLASSKHSGVKALFNKNLVKTGDISTEKGRLYNRLFEARQEGDYVDFVVFERDIVEPWIPEVSEFIKTLTRLAEK